MESLPFASCPAWRAEHPWIVTQRFDLGDNDSLKVCMLWIEQPVVFARSQGGRHNQDATPCRLHKFISDPREFRWCRRAAPGRWELVRVDVLFGEVFRDLGSNQDQIWWGVIGVEVNEVFQHGQGLMFGSVGKTSSRARPAPAI